MFLFQGGVIMKRNEQVKRLINKYGQPVSALSEDGWSSGNYFAFVQPVRYKNKMYLNDVESPIGTVSENYYLYVGPSDVILKGMEGRIEIITQSMKCTVERSESVYFGSEVLYNWAILRKVVEDE